MASPYLPSPYPNERALSSLASPRSITQYSRLFVVWSDHKKQSWVVIPACPKPRGDVTVLPIPGCSVLDPRLPKETLSPQDPDISGML